MIDRFEYEVGNAVATGFPVGEGPRPKFVVEAGSTALLRNSGANREGLLPSKREALMESGILYQHPRDPTLLVFSQNHVFSSATAAGDIVNGANTSAPEKWKCRSTGIALKDWLKA